MENIRRSTNIVALKRKCCHPPFTPSSTKSFSTTPCCTTHLPPMSQHFPDNCNSECNKRRKSCSLPRYSRMFYYFRALSLQQNVAYSMCVGKFSVRLAVG